MKPKDSNTNTPAKENCIPTSAKCIIWQGPDIPCINLCRGDHIEQVVFKMATKLCELVDGLLDVSQLDFECLIGPGLPDPKDLKELLQRLISKVCDLEECCDEEGPTFELPVITLPECLVYTDEDTELEVTELPLDELAELLATKICEILADIEQIQIDIENLDTRVTELENTVNGLPEPLDEVTIDTQCLSYTDTVGEELPVKEAFENLETRLCNYIAILGSTGNLQAAISEECPDLAEEEQLSNPDDDMMDLTNWVDVPSTVSDTITNMWLTICDMREYLKTISSSGVTCIPISPTGLVIDNLTTTTFDITWVDPVTTGTEPPSAYEITIVEYDGFVEGATIYTTIVSPNINTLTLSNYLYTENVTYMVKVRAVYETCGNSAYATAYGNLKDDLDVLCVEHSVSTAEVVAATCLASPVNNERRELTLTLKSTITGDPVINNTGGNLVFTVNLTYTDCSGAISTDTRSVILPNGQSSVVYQYWSVLHTDCGGPTCGPETFVFDCITPPAGYTLCDTDDLCP